MNQYLEGGRENKIFRKDDRIYRPAEEWSQYIQAYLRYLHDMGFHKVPYPYGISSEGQEILSYVEGTVHNGLLPEAVKSDAALKSVAMMMKDFHDHGAEYIKQLKGTEKWMLSERTPVETMCHGDFAPYNIAMDGEVAAGIIDFDTLHPGPRLWDIAYALYRWIPLMAPSNSESFGSEEDKERRLKIFSHSYGLINIENQEIILWVIKRLECLVDYMKQEADHGNETFKKNIEEGHLDSYLMDLDYLRNY